MTNRRSSAELREEISASSSEARRFISALFDEGTFLETGTYIRHDTESDFEGVITGCGAVDGRLVFTFVQDMSCGRAALTYAHAAKISALYDKAIKAKAPVVGVYTSAGAKLSGGIDALSGLGEVMSKMVSAKKEIPQISVISGACGGGMAALSSLADFTVADTENGSRYILPNTDDEKKFRYDIAAKGTEELASKTKELLNFLPSSSADGTVYALSRDDINDPSCAVEDILSTDRDVKELIAEISDDGKMLEIGGGFAKEAVCGFAMINGRAVGLVADQPIVNGGALTSKAAKKIAGFVDFLGRFNIPVLTLVNTVGFGGNNCGCYTDNLAALASSYSNCRSAKVTVVVGKAYGSAFTFMGSKRLGADMVFALDCAEISVMTPETAVEFVWDDKLKNSPDPASARDELKKEWIENVASPLAAARHGDIDDIVSYSELKQRIAAAFEVFC